MGHTHPLGYWATPKVSLLSRLTSAGRAMDWTDWAALLIRVTVVVALVIVVGTILACPFYVIHLLERGLLG